MDLTRYPLHAEDEDGLLTRLMEECAEVIKACSKAQRFGIKTNYQGVSNAQNIADELYDVGLVQAELWNRYLLPGARTAVR
jgi:NTP pyrophosphatase (non-canonical NTP hydrolase)